MTADEQRGGWRNIATAPRDGTAILLAIAGEFNGCPLIGAGRWTVEGPMHWWQGVSANSINLRNATHWRPLPEAPSQPGQHDAPGMEPATSQAEARGLA